MNDEVLEGVIALSTEDVCRCLDSTRCLAHTKFLNNIHTAS